MERKKNCHYCNKEFTAKRIDARYCSPSCRQMGYRKKADPDTYGKVVPVHFEIDDEEYAQLLRMADDLNMDPNQCAKHLLFNTREYGDYVHLFFKEHEWHRWIEPALAHYDLNLPDKMVMKWVKDRIFEEKEKGNI